MKLRVKNPVVDDWTTVPGWNGAKQEYRDLDCERWIRENGIREAGRENGKQEFPRSDADQPDEMYMKILDWVNKRGKACHADVSKYLAQQRYTLEIEAKEGMAPIRHKVEGLREQGVVELIDPYYLFDIAIRDDDMEVQRLPIPKGSAEDDHGMPYVAEAKGLALDTIPYGKPLTDEQMRTVMRHLYEKGKASQIRTYSCVFYVRVWDETHSEAKKRWKQALALLQQLFGTHQVRGTSWKDRHEEPVNVPISSRRAAP